tara:strand:+ start:451 stop:834 length:384 start_codon:yes stop_codon:yes gene_type:complete
MENEFVPYKQSLELKELGFDETCFCIYNREMKIRFNNLHNPMDRDKNAKLTANNGRYPAPLYQQAFRWFRENYDLSGLIEIGTHEFSYQIFKNGNRQLGIEPIKYNGNYEEAEFECLKKLIEIVKTK